MVDTATTLRLIKYSLLQVTIGPSLICDLIVFIHFIRRWRREILNTPHNHVILCLLIVSFAEKTTDLPLSLYFLRWGVVAQQTDRFCTIWSWWNYSTYAVSLHLVTWCCIERHLFVFHSQMMKKRFRLILFHYIPITICLIYAPLFYVAVLIFPTTCTNVWDYTYIFCGAGCYSYDRFLGTYDWLFHLATPILIILFANFLLFARIIWQKIKHQRPFQWRHQKQMIIQLAFISILYIIFMSPQVIVGVIESVWSPTFALDIQLDYFFYISNFINQFLPFIIVSSLPEIQKELKRWIQHIKSSLCRERQIHPIKMMTTTGGNRIRIATLY